MKGGRAYVKGRLLTQYPDEPKILIMSKSNQKDNFQLFREHLEELIRARTPLFYLGGIEIKRCIQELEIVASRLNVKIQSFHLSRGVLESGEEKKTTDPIGILDTIIKWVNTTTSEKQTIWVLPFFHPIPIYLEPITVMNHVSEFPEG